VSSTVSWSQSIASWISFWISPDVSPFFHSVFLERE